MRGQLRFNHKPTFARVRGKMRIGSETVPPARVTYERGLRPGVFHRLGSLRIRKICRTGKSRHHSHGQGLRAGCGKGKCLPLNVGSGMGDRSGDIARGRANLERARRSHFSSSGECILRNCWDRRGVDAKELGAIILSWVSSVVSHPRGEHQS